MSFRLKTILGIAFIEILLLAILVISGLTYLHRSTGEQLHNRAKTTVKLFASMTSDAVVSLDLATLDSLVAEMLRNPDVIYARVRGESGSILVQDGNPEALESPFREDTDISGAGSDARFDISHDILVAGHKFGQVEIGIGISALQTIIANATAKLLFLAGLEIALVAIFGFILGGILTKQLSSIQKGAKRVAEGQFGYQIDVAGNDELADTARSFNRMSAALWDYARELTDARERAETVLQDAVESAPQGILVVDEEGSVRIRNSAFQRLYPGDIQELESASTYREITEITSRHVVATQLRALPQVLPSSGGHETLELVDGRHLYRTVRPMKQGGYVVVETDVTPLYEAQERARNLEIELLHASKLEALGTLAGGIAHEINTPIQYIGDNLRFMENSFVSMKAVLDAYEGLLASIPDSVTDMTSVSEARAKQDLTFLLDEIPQAISQSIDGVAQVSRIVLAMKEFSHPSTKERRSIDINKVIERATIVCRGEWKNVASLNLQLDPRLPNVSGFEGELNQVILNMVVNAAHAIEKRGLLPGEITIRTAPDDDGIAITIEDTGSGIPDSIRSRIFEPFFTTKPVGQGTGQGLAICRDVVVNKHGGRIDIIRTNGSGTTFRLYLPADGNDLSAPPSANSAEILDFRSARI